MKLAPLSSLSSLSDRELFARVRTFIGLERRVVAKLVLFLAEVERRGVHYEKAYSSLQDFCAGFWDERG